VTRSDGTGSESLSCYTNQYFSALEIGVIPSARVIVPLVLGLVRARSVIDIGCGRGAWLKVFRENGVTDIHGMDGSHVDPESLLIDPSEFTAADLARPFTIARTYDLAVCLEVAEHLPAAAAPALVRELTRAAPVVLFSAAIPGQQGLGHVNEQWPMYWSRLFESHGSPASIPSVERYGRTPAFFPFTARTSCSSHRLRPLPPRRALPTRRARTGAAGWS
jgi:SAM-dependent methyltransferase